MSIVTKDKLKAAAALSDVRIVERDHQLVTAEGLDFMGERKDATYLLLVNENRKWFFSQKKSKAFPVEILLHNGTTIVLDAASQLKCH